MADFQNTTALTIATERGFVWLQYRASAQCWFVEAHARCPCGVMYLQKDYPGESPPLADVVVDDALEQGIFSPRPCKLDGYIDPSMSNCVLALLCQFCRDRKIDIPELFEQSYPDDRPLSTTDFAFVVLQGIWEGIVVPGEWSTEVVDALLDALAEVGWDALSDRLEQKLFPCT